MGRPKTDVRISLKGRDGKTVRVGLVRRPDGQWTVYRNGNLSRRHPSTSSTEIGRLIAGWLRQQAFEKAGNDRRKGR